MENNIINNGNITGKIVSLFPASGGVTLIRLMALANTDGEAIADFPSITVFKNSVPNLEDYKVGDHVLVTVHIETRRVRENGKTRYYQDIVASNIETCVTDRDVNVIRLQAPVDHIYRPLNSPVVFCSLKFPFGRNRYNFPSICCYGKIGQVVEDKIRVGDVVQLQCAVRTKKGKDENGKTVTRQSIVCQSLIKVSSGDDEEDGDNDDDDVDSSSRGGL